MRFPISQYIESLTRVTGYCVNVPDTGIVPWTGFMFKVRNELDKYNSVEEWREDGADTTLYTYRDFGDPAASPDVVKGEFSMWYSGYVGDRFTDIMIQYGNIMFIYGIEQKVDKTIPLTDIEEIAFYMYYNRYSL